MSTIHSINQDDVLGANGSLDDSEELSPSEFDTNSRETGVDSHPDSGSSKRGSILTMIGGIFIALAIVVFFGWKIAAPYFSGGGQSNSNRDVLAPNSAAIPQEQFQTKPQPFAPEPVQTGTPALAATQTQQGGSQVAADPFAAQVATVVADKTVISQQASSAANVAVLQSAVPAEDITRIDKRINDIDAALVALKDTVARLQGEIQKSRTTTAAKTTSVVARAAPASKTADDSIAVVKSATTATPKKSGGTDKGVSPDSTSAHELQLQAVLQDRAWFKTKTGDTLTVSPGEELRGVGVVKQIDAESGRVVFTNGVVFR